MFSSILPQKMHYSYNNSTLCRLGIKIPVWNYTFICKAVNKTAISLITVITVSPVMSSAPEGMKKQWFLGRPNSQIGTPGPLRPTHNAAGRPGQGGTIVWWIALWSHYKKVAVQYDSGLSVWYSGVLPKSPKIYKLGWLATLNCLVHQCFVY